MIFAVALFDVNSESESVLVSSIYETHMHTFSYTLDDVVWSLNIRIYNNTFSQLGF